MIMWMRIAAFWVWVVVINTVGAMGSEWSYEGATITLAHLNISYFDAPTGAYRTDVGELGKFGHGAVGGASGLLVVGRTTEGDAHGRSNRHGCSVPWATTPPKEPWVALVARGECPDRDKVANAFTLNASAILIYAKDAHAHLQKIALSTFSRERGVVVFLGQQQGEQLARLVENGTRVHVAITKGHDIKYTLTSINRYTGTRLREFGTSRAKKRDVFVTLNPFCEREQVLIDCVIVTSVLFVSVSFIILMVISLAWLIFYYIQRFRYIHAKDRLARHLCNAAKKALSKIPVKNLKSGDKEVAAENECCAVCIEPYQISDTVRTLPCKHQFHKSCVDPWLLEHRTCPMCKMDILKFYGYVFSGSTETVVPVDDELEFELSLTDSEESVLHFEMVDETSGGEVEVRVPTPPPPPHPRSGHISQVMVVPRPESSAVDTTCDGWSESPVPDTPISPVHQPTSTIPPSSATSSVIRSVLGSALASHSGRVSHSSHSPPASAVSRASISSTPAEREKDDSTEAAGHSQGEGAFKRHSKSDLELASVCSEDFHDAFSAQSVLEVLTDDGGLMQSHENPDPTDITGATNGLYVVPCEYNASTPFCNIGNSGSARSAPSSAQSKSSHSGSPAHKSAASRKRSTSRTRSSKRRSSRARSTSRRRSASRARSPHRERSASCHNSPMCSASAAALRSARLQSQPSSQVVSVSHI